MTTMGPYIEFHSRPGNWAGWLCVRDGKARISRWWEQGRLAAVDPSVPPLGARIRVFAAPIGGSTIRLTDLYRTNEELSGR